MSSTSTTWSAQGNTKAGVTVSTTDALTTGTLTADTIQLSSNIIKASDGGSTITLDTSDNVTIAGDLTISGNNLIFGNGEQVVNTTDGQLGFNGAGSYIFYGATNDAKVLIRGASAGTSDAGIILYNHTGIGAPEWSICFDDSDGDTLKFDAGTATVGDATKLSLTESGNMTIAGDLTISGGNITSALTLDSTLTVTNTTQLNNTLTVGVDDTGYDVKFFGDTASNYMLWNTSGDRLDIITTHNSTALRVQSNATRSTSDAPDIEIRKQSVPNDDDYLGSLKWISLDAGGSTGRTYGEIDCFVRDQDDNAADGSIIFNVLSHGSVTQGLKIRSTNNGSSADVEVAVNKGNLHVGANTVTQGAVDIKRKDSNEFGYIKMYSSDGTASFLFVANDGTLRIHNAIPTANGDGSAV